MHFARYPRIKLAHLPTPLEPMPRLSKELGTQASGGVEIWIKRDDCTGLSTGGNKTRKLEFLMAEAVEQKAELVVTQGAIQSNHARQTAAFAATLGLDCHLLLENRIQSEDPDYHHNGNVFLDHLYGATTEERPGGLDMNMEMEACAEKFRQQGRTVYAIPGGGSNPVGALGYANCALELVHQANERRLKIDHIVHATGSCGTQAGLLVGLAAIHARIPVLGIGVRAPKPLQEENIFRLVTRTQDFMECPAMVNRHDVVANTDYVGAGYGIHTEATVEAIEMFAQLEGILLDPVYSGKGAAGMIDLIRKGHFKGQRIVFLHTGGSAALFGYTQAFGYGK